MINKNFKYIFYGIFLSLFVFSLYFISSSTPQLMVEQSAVLNQNIQYSDSWCVTHRKQSGKIVSMECDIENTLHNDGMDMLMNFAMDGSGGAITNFSLCNSSVSAGADVGGCGVPTAGGSENFTTYEGCGLGAANGTTAVSPGSGNWTVEYTFTASCAGGLESNVTRLGNDSTKFATLSFSEVTLQDTDTLTINASLKQS